MKQLTVAQAAEILGVSAAAVRMALKRRTLKAKKFGKSWMISTKQLNAYKTRTNR